MLPLEVYLLLINKILLLARDISLLQSLNTHIYTFIIVFFQIGLVYFMFGKVLVCLN